jgi:hypothetical protein
MSRNALTCATDDSSQRITGTSVIPSFARCFESQVTIDDLAVTAGEHRNLESELANRADYPIDGAVVLAWVLDEALD